MKTRSAPLLALVLRCLLVVAIGLLTLPAFAHAQATSPPPAAAPGLVPNDPWSVVLMIFRDDWLKFNLALLAASILVSLGAALFSSRIQFFLGESASWLLTRVLPYFLCWGGLKLIVLAAFGEYVQLANGLIGVTSAFVTAALLAKIADSIRTIGIPIPDVLGSKPKIEARATP